MGKIHSLETFGTVDGPGGTVCRFFSGLPDALPVLPQSRHVEDRGWGRNDSG